MNAPLRRFSFLLAAPVLSVLTGCSGLELPKLSMPKMKMPDLKMPDVKVPFVSDDGTAPANDPEIPFSLKQALAPGHTLDITAYAGQRSPVKIFSGAIMVDDEGKVDLGKFGKVKLGGLSASRAVNELEGAFRRKRKESLISIQLKHIESTPLLQVVGAVAHAGVIQFYDGASPASILSYTGGRDPRATGRAVYVTREGVRKFHPDFATADVELQRGDIVTYSEEL
jgi:protein involved in polysaccharide export with SLBB domain